MESGQILYEINRIKNAVTEAYTAVDEKNGLVTINSSYRPISDLAKAIQNISNQEIPKNYGLITYNGFELTIT